MIKVHKAKTATAAAEPISGLCITSPNASNTGMIWTRWRTSVPLSIPTTTSLALFARLALLPGTRRGVAYM